MDDDHRPKQELHRQRMYQVIDRRLPLRMHLLQPDVLLVQVGAEVAAVEDGEVEEEGGGDGALPAVVLDGGDERLAEEGDAEVEGDGHGGLDAEEEAVGDDEEDGGEPGGRVVEEAGHEEDGAVRVRDDGEEEPELRQPWLVVAAHEREIGSMAVAEEILIVLLWNFYFFTFFWILGNWNWGKVKVELGIWVFGLE